MYSKLVITRITPVLCCSLCVVEHTQPLHDPQSCTEKGSLFFCVASLIGKVSFYLPDGDCFHKLITLSKSCTEKGCTYCTRRTVRTVRLFTAETEREVQQQTTIQIEICSGQLMMIICTMR